MKGNNPDLFAGLMNRMKRIEGQARGIQRLLAEGADCQVVVTQLAAMRQGVTQVAVKVAACQLGVRMAEEIQRGGSGQDAVDGMLDVFKRLG
jgi:DNA-binding FrmR family transcriptional regulator